MVVEILRKKCHLFLLDVKKIHIDIVYHRSFYSFQISFETIILIPFFLNESLKMVLRSDFERHKTFSDTILSLFLVLLYLSATMYGIVLRTIP